MNSLPSDGSDWAMDWSEVKDGPGRGGKSLGALVDGEQVRALVGLSTECHGAPYIWAVYISSAGAKNGQAESLEEAMSAAHSWLLEHLSGHRTMRLSSLLASSAES